MSFGVPLALLGLLAIPVGVGLFALWRRRYPPPSVPFPDVDLLLAAAPGPRLRRHLPLALLLLALAGLGFALARPEISRSVPREQATIMLAVDVSGSMAASDVEPYRLRAAQDAALRFAERVPRQYAVGLVSFSGSATLLLAPSTDREALRSAIEGLVADGATAIGEAVVASLESMRSQQPDVPRLEAARILLLSDGSNTTGIDVEDAAEQAKSLGVPVFTVALGTPDGILPDGRPVPPDPDALCDLAEDTGGDCFESRDAESVAQVYERLGSFIGTEEVQDEVTGWPLGIAAALLLLAGLAAWRLSPRVP